MQTAIQAKAHTTKLRELLGRMGRTLKHSQCLEAMSKVGGYSDWNTHAAEINNNQQLAEEFLSEIFEAEAEADYGSFTQRCAEIYLVAYPEHRFLDSKSPQERYLSYRRICVKVHKNDDIRYVE